jgi:hypothetical protein
MRQLTEWNSGWFLMAYLDEKERRGCAVASVTISAFFFVVTGVVCGLLLWHASEIPSGNIAVLAYAVTIGSFGFGLAWLAAFVGAFFRRWVVFVLVAEAPFLLLCLTPIVLARLGWL